MSVRIVVQGTRVSGDEKREIMRRGGLMLRALKRTKDELSILLTNDERMRELNASYRKKDRSTDVLAFAMSEGEFGEVTPGLLGDVVISLPYARRQATEGGKTLLEEVTFLLAHGVLHLLGWDHETQAKDRAMRAETDRLCAFASAPDAEPSR